MPLDPYAPYVTLGMHIDAVKVGPETGQSHCLVIVKLVVLNFEVGF